MSEDSRQPALPIVPDLHAARRRRKRPDIVADRIRDLIIERALKPGDRLPAEWIRPETHDVSRGTLREALKVLEAQGLTASKTGPGGGVFVSRVDPVAALQLMHNLFLFQPPSLAEIFRLRSLLEPKMAACLAGGVSREAFAGLHERIELYGDDPTTPEEHVRKRLAELDFELELARLCPDRLLGFLCSFLISLLRDIVLLSAKSPSPPSPSASTSTSTPNPQEPAANYQVRLLRAIRRQDPSEAEAVMREHLRETARMASRLATPE